MLNGAKDSQADVPAPLVTEDPADGSAGLLDNHTLRVLACPPTLGMRYWASPALIWIRRVQLFLWRTTPTMRCVIRMAVGVRMSGCMRGVRWMSVSMARRHCMGVRRRMQGAWWWCIRSARARRRLAVGVVRGWTSANGSLRGRNADSCHLAASGLSSGGPSLRL